MSNARIKRLFPIWPVASALPVGEKAKRKVNTPTAPKPDKKKTNPGPNGKRHIDTYV